MPIWGEHKITWRQVLPGAIVAAALVCLGFTVHSCVRRERRRISTDTEFEFYRKRLESSDPDAVAGAIRLLGERGIRKALPLIRPKLASDDPRVKAAACAAVGRLGDQESADALLSALQHPDRRVQAGSAEGLGALRETRAVQPLLKLLDTADADTRYATIVALGEIGDPAATERLKALAANPTAGLDPARAGQLRDRIQAALDAALEKLASAP
jgi:HEAT repeat protein